MSPAVHLRNPGGYACGTGRRWPSQQISSVTARHRVTCRNCTRTRAYRDQENTVADKPAIPTLTITPEQAAQLNETGRRIGKAAHDFGQALTQAYARALPDIQEKLTKIDTSGFGLAD